MNNIPEALLEIGGLVDCVIEATGVAQISTTGYQCLDRGGTLAIVGLAKPGETLQINLVSLSTCSRLPPGSSVQPLDSSSIFYRRKR